jgi:hypothetical protein
MQCLEPQYTRPDISINVFFLDMVPQPNGYECVFSFVPTKVCGYRFSSEWRIFSRPGLEPARCHPNQREHVLPCGPRLPRYE